MRSTLLPDGKLRFQATTGLMGGRWYAVHDIRIVAGRIRKVPLKSDRATHRLFVQTDTGRWTYAFTAGESRALAVPALERQTARPSIACRRFPPNVLRVVCVSGSGTARSPSEKLRDCIIGPECSSDGSALKGMRRST